MDREEQAVMGRQIQGVLNEKTGMELVQGEERSGGGGGWGWMTVMNVRLQRRRHQEKKKE